MPEPSDVQTLQEAYVAARDAALKAKADFGAAWATWAEACQRNNDTISELWKKDNRAGGSLPLMYPNSSNMP